MHILVTNDDGPPSDQSSPYVHSLVSNLQASGHTISVLLPHTQRSWIGKAHLVGHSLTPTYYRPHPLTTHPATKTLHNSGTTHATPLTASEHAQNPEQEEWLLVDSTPASCVQIGLHHYFPETRGPVDLVVSGPNYGRNSTAVFSLSSGTIGGAMEAAISGVKAIALSYAFFDRNHDAEVIQGASELSVRLIEHLWKNWDEGCHLYSVNVPLVEGVAGRKIMWTKMLENRWSSGSCFQVVDAPTATTGGDKDTPRESEARIREEERAVETQTAGLDESRTKARATPMRYIHKTFQWAPSFKDVHESVERSEPGNDGWAVMNKFTSVTPLRANFMHATGKFEGEIKL